jgi:hypothetical protein
MAMLDRFLERPGISEDLRDEARAAKRDSEAPQ